MTVEAGIGEPKKLPVWGTIAEACRTLAANATALAVMSLVPILLSMSSILVAHALTPRWFEAVLQALFLLGWVLLCVPWLRLLLLEDRTARGLFPRLSRRHLRVAGYALLLTLIDAPLYVFWYGLGENPEAFQGAEIFNWLIYIFVSFLKLRFAFVYPAIAVDERYSLKLAWRHSQSASLPLLAILVIAVVAPFAGISYGLNALMASDQLPYLWWALWHVGIWVIQAVYLTILAIAFRRCTGWVPAPDSAILERFE